MPGIPGKFEKNPGFPGFSFGTGIANPNSYPLSKIINASFLSGIFPQKLKLSRIVPVFKQGDKDNPSNYRPISSLPYINKIYERCTTNRLIYFLINSIYFLTLNLDSGNDSRLRTVY